jgi:hypothetical protein
MTHYDKLIDSIIDEIYYVWTEISEWDSEHAQEVSRETAHRILEHVEEFQTLRTGIKQWRATD